MKKQLEEEEKEEMPHLADGGVAGDFEVDGGDSDTAKGLPLNPAAVPPTEPTAAPPKPVDMASIPPPSAPLAQPKPMPGMPPGVTPEMLQQYLGGQKQQLEKYGPDQQMALQQQLIKARTGLGPSLANAGAGFADAIMQGVARAGNPGFQEKLQNQGNQLAAETMGTSEKAGEQNLQQLQAKQKIDEMNPSSPLSKTAQNSIGAVLVDKLHYSPDEVAKMSAAQIQSTAELAMKYEDIATQAALKKQMEIFQQEYQTGMLQNTAVGRQTTAADVLAKLGIMGRATAPKETIAALTKAASGQASAPAPRPFDSVGAAEAAGLPIGTKVMINGRSATIK